jgi:hypothetical protein
LRLGTDFSVSKNSSGQTVITFLNAPPTSATVTVSYNAVLTMSSQTGSNFTYSLVGGKPTLQFTNPLAAGALVSVSYVVGDTNVTEFSATSLTLQIASFATVSGNFVFRQVGTGPSAVIEVGADDLNVNIGASYNGSFTGLAVTGASLGMVVYGDGYALMINGGSDALLGVPDLTLTASGLVVRAITTSHAVQNYAITIPGSSAPIVLNFTESPGFFEAEGYITLGVANLGTVSGDFGLQRMSDGGTGTYLAFGINNVNLVFGTSDTNFTITGASLGILIHTSNGNTSYAVSASSGTTTLNGVPDLTFTGSLSVKYDSGIDTSAVTVPAIQTTSTYTLAQTLAGGSAPVVTYSANSVTTTLAAGTDYVVSTDASGHTKLTFIHALPQGAMVTVT